MVPHVGHGCLLSVHHLIPAAANTILALAPSFPSQDLCLPLAAPESPRMSPPWAPGRGLELGPPSPAEQGRSEMLPSSHRPLPGTPPQLHRFPPPPDGEGGGSDHLFREGLLDRSGVPAGIGEGELEIAQLVITALYRAPVSMQAPPPH